MSKVLSRSIPTLHTISCNKQRPPLLHNRSERERTESRQHAADWCVYIYLLYKLECIIYDYVYVSKCIRVHACVIMCVRVLITPHRPLDARVEEVKTPEPEPEVQHGNIEHRSTSQQSPKGGPAEHRGLIPHDERCAFVSSY
jgi:ferredoxin